MNFFSFIQEIILNFMFDIWQSKLTWQISQLHFEEKFIKCMKGLSKIDFYHLKPKTHNHKSRLHGSGGLNTCFTIIMALWADYLLHAATSYEPSSSLCHKNHWCAKHQKQFHGERDFVLFSFVKTSKILITYSGMN